MKTKTIHQILAGVAILFMLLTVRPALAAEWVFCESNRSGHLYYDKTSILKTGDVAQVRTMTIFSDDGKAELSDAFKRMGKASGNPDLLSYSISSDEFDCVNRKMKLSSVTIYNEKGAAIYTSVSKNAGWDDVIPGTNGEILGKIVCSGLK
jgi:hypothetical protein